MLITLVLLAIGYPGLIEPGGRVPLLGLVVLLGTTLLPAGMVWFGVGRSRAVEFLGWCLQACMIVLVFVY